MPSCFDCGPDTATGITGNAVLDRCLRKHRAKRKRKKGKR